DDIQNSGMARIIAGFGQRDLPVDPPRKTLQDIAGGMTYQATAKVFEYVEPDEAAQTVASSAPRLLINVLNKTNAAVATNGLHDNLGAQTVQALEATAESPVLTPSLKYGHHTAGTIMNPKFLAVNRNLTAVLALDVIRMRARYAVATSYALVLDEEEKLVGHVAIVDIALARHKQTVDELCRADVVSVTVDTDQEECTRIMQRYNVNELPVVDANGVLRGIIMGDDVLDVLKEEATEDMYRLAGVGHEAVFGPLSGALKSRLPWLGVNLATAFLAALAIGLFETAIGRVVALAVLLPLVTSQGGMGGIQTLTLAVRSMALGELPSTQGMKLVSRELMLGAAHGLLFGLLVGIATYAWKGDYMLGVVLAVAMLGNMVIAGLTGAGVPLLLRKAGHDPAVSSAVFITTFTDIMGILLFLGIATVVIERLA
ncbi:MAG: magnesium transporter, partial [Chloroflexota bacterium]|nr:magnesium transporter [Chloroflexota bacterium]